MPTHFGPSLGPRQGIDGRRYDCLENSRDLTVEAIFNADPCQLEKLMPPGFSLRYPNIVCLSFIYSTEVEWLAGRGYNLFGVTVPATYNGQQDVVDGDLQLVLWENMADPIITGREDLGFAKVYCELPEPQFMGYDVTCRASWDGCEFAQLQLSGLQDITMQELPQGHPSEGTLHYKYIPKTSAPGQSDSEYAALTPAACPNLKVDQTMLAKAATCKFRESTWEQLPTLVHIVNTLSTLSLGDCISATLIRSHGGKDFSDQRILR
jgi:hypothetical protein